MPWSNWIELSFRHDGTLDTSPLSGVPRVSGVYAIASKKQAGFYVTHYVGRSSHSIRERLQRHLSGHGNGVVRLQLELKRNIPSAPASICVAFLQTSEPKIVEALFLDSSDLPICNIYRARLPAGLSEWLVRQSELER
jgi:hypothetical protein